MIPHRPAPTIRPVDPGPVRRVLLIRPRYLGDVCLTLPALDAVRAACPAAQVAYLTERESAPLIEGDPRVDELIVVPRSPGPRENITLIRRLRRFAPDVAFDFFCNPRTALWTALSGARVRVGYPNKGWRTALDDCRACRAKSSSQESASLSPSGVTVSSSRRWNNWMKRRRAASVR